MINIQSSQNFILFLLYLLHQSGLEGRHLFLFLFQSLFMVQISLADHFFIVDSVHYTPYHITPSHHISHIPPGDVKSQTVETIQQHDKTVIPVHKYNNKAIQTTRITTGLVSHTVQIVRLDTWSYSWEMKWSWWSLRPDLVTFERQTEGQSLSLFFF